MYSMRPILALSLTASLSVACSEAAEPAYLPTREEAGGAADTANADTANAGAAHHAAPREIPPRPTPAPPRPEPEAIPAPEDVAAPPRGAQRTASGLASRVVQPGSGATHPGPADTVTVHYTGWRAEDGEMFDSSVARGRPATFALNRVIAGWTEGLQLMVQGEKRRLWIPANLAYEGRPGPQGMLVFDVELLEVQVAPQAPETPSDVSAPPRSAERTASGLASRVLQAGTGDRHPAATDRVQVHYTGWRSEDGEMFDSSVTRGSPATFPLNRVIAGWTEGLQLMVVGEKRRFWIPANLAYEGRAGPQGMLVFDVELLQIM